MLTEEKTNGYAISIRNISNCNNNQCRNIIHYISKIIQSDLCDTGTAEFADGWAKTGEYIGYYMEGKRNGKGCSYGINGDKLKDGMWDMGEFATGIEYDWLIHVDQGELIYNSKENDYDASEDFAYSAYEQYGMNIVPFMNSETYIEHYHLADCYVADLKVDGDTEQLVNIRTLEQYLQKKNPKRLQHLREMME